MTKKTDWWETNFVTDDLPKEVAEKLKEKLKAKLTGFAEKPETNKTITNCHGLSLYLLLCLS